MDPPGYLLRGSKPELTVKIFDGRRVSRGIPVWGEGFTLSELVELFLYDPRFGYYAAGKVRFGITDGAHYETVPHTLSPVYGELLARHAHQIFLCMLDLHILNERDRFFAVEIGPGDGTLAHDFMAYVAKQSARDSSWKGFRRRLKYLLIDRAPSLSTWHSRLKKFGGQLEFIHADVTDRNCVDFSKLRITGLIFSNEVLDNFPHDRVRLDGRESCVSVYTPVIGRQNLQRVLGMLDGCAFRAKDRISGRQRRDVLMSKKEFLRLATAHPNDRLRRELCRNLGWKVQWISTRQYPRIRRAVKRVKKYRPDAREGLSMYVCPSYADFYSVLRSVLVQGVIFTIDYGGMINFVASEHYPHMRVFGSREPRRVFRGLGDQDITFDVDFGALIELGHEYGFDTVFVGPERALADFVDVDLRKSALRGRIAKKRMDVLGEAKRKSEARVAAEIEEFYRDRRSKLLIQVKGCEGMGLYG